MARRLFSSTPRGSFGGVGMSGSQFTGLVSVATVVATRLEILGLNGHPWNTWKAKIAS
jgi:hypothetical protein